MKLLARILLLVGLLSVIGYCARPGPVANAYQTQPPGSPLYAWGETCESVVTYSVTFSSTVPVYVQSNSTNVLFSAPAQVLVCVSDTTTGVFATWSESPDAGAEDALTSGIWAADADSYFGADEGLTMFIPSFCQFHGIKSLTRFKRDGVPRGGARQYGCESTAEPCQVNGECSTGNCDTDRSQWKQPQRTYLVLESVAGTGTAKVMVCQGG